MNLSFRPTAEALESRNAPVILMPVPGLLAIFAVEGLSFPTYSEPQRTKASDRVAHARSAPQPAIAPSVSRVHFPAHT